MPVTAHMDQGRQRLVEIENQMGIFRCTGNHLVAVMTGIGTYEFKKASELKPGSRMAFVNHDIPGDVTELPSWGYDCSEDSTACADISVPELTSEVAWFLGYFLGGGYVRADHKENGFNAEVVMAVANDVDAAAIVDRLDSVFSAFGVSTSKTHPSSCDDSWEVRATSKQLARYFCENFKQPETATKVPECVLRGTLRVRAAFLAGVLDSGGHNNKPVVLCASVYPTFLEELQSVYASIGIPTRLKLNRPEKDTWQPMCHLSLVGTEAVSFFGEKVQSFVFRSNSKQATTHLFSRLGGDTKGLCPIEVLEVRDSEIFSDTYDIEVAGAEEFVASGLLVHNSALITLGHISDQEFRDAKKDSAAVMSHRHTSNNSVAFQDWDQLNNFDWRGLVADNIDFGEPGILNLPLGRQTDPGVKGVNPCFSGDTRIAVADGRDSVTIQELAEAGVDVPVYSVSRQTGKVEIKMGRHPRITGFGKELLRVWLDDGGYLDTTPDHSFLRLDGSKVSACDLVPGDSLPRFTATGEHVHCDTRDPSVEATPKSQLVVPVLQEDNDSASVTKKCEVCGTLFETLRGFRERSFCSDTCVSAYSNHEDRLSAPKIESEQARVCSGLMFELGRDPSHIEWSHACAVEGVAYHLGLASSFRHFREVLSAGAAYNHRVVKVEKLPGEHTVYNITVDDHHTVAVITESALKKDGVHHTGVYVAQCGEQLLHDREACNLAEVFPAKFGAGTDPITVFRLVTRYCLRQRLTPLSDERSHAVGKRNMRVGVGLGGICDFEWTPELLARWFGACRREADSYAEELGVSKPITVTTVKPSGTISLVNSSSPGVHASHSPYYIRRVRIAKNDPMSAAMAEAGVTFEEDLCDETHNTWVYSFPMKADNPKVTKESETLRDQFERQATIQEWWADNAVSSTINFDAETEREELAACFEEFVPRLKSTAVLPKGHGYVQAPYEAIDEATYKEMARGINHDSKLVGGGDIEVEECEGGVCPIR
jgi:intein/homing endonuclease